MDNLRTYFLVLTFLSTTLFSSISIKASEEKTEAFIARLKAHYQDTRHIKAFTLNYHFLNTRYRSFNYWDHEYPNRYMSVRSVEVDLERKHFYDNDVLYYSGGRLYDRVQFQNDTEAYFYEKNATTLGKTIVDIGMNAFDRSIKGYMVLNIDFLAVRPLLDENNVKDAITLKKNKTTGTITLTHQTSADHIVDYEFSVAPLQLVSINYRPHRGKLFYSDYQTTRGLTFARTIHKYYDGATEPTYTSFIDQFHVIDRVEPERLKVPEGYGPVLQRGDGVFVAEEIADNLYLVTDSSASRNSLFKVNGDEIMVFGASGNTDFAEKNIKLIQKQFPNKKITSVYVSHPHTNQIAGLHVYADAGIEVLADEYTIAAIKAFPAFADNISEFTFRPIKHAQVIAGARFYVLENLHAKRQSFVYFEEPGYIFQADFLHVPFDNTISDVVPNYTKLFIDFLRKNKLKTNRIIGNHRNNDITVDVMDKLYEVEVNLHHQTSALSPKAQ